MNLKECTACDPFMNGSLKHREIVPDACWVGLIDEGRQVPTSGLLPSTRVPSYRDDPKSFGSGVCAKQILSMAK